MCPIPAHFESLEDRKLMSASLNGGLLYLIGNIGTSNTIATTVSGNTLNYNINGQTGTFPLNQIQEIRVIGGIQNDNVSMDANLTVGVNINTNDGNDTIYGGAGNDSIFAGSGNDYVDGRGGSNTFQGGGSSSTVTNANWSGHTTTTTGGGSTNTGGSTNSGGGTTTISGAPVINSISLINADTGAVIMTLPTYGGTFDLGQLPTRHVNFRPNTSGTVKSVMWDYDGQYEYNITNNSPFLMSNSATSAPTVGNHNLFALAASDLNEGGARSDQSWLYFTVTDSGGNNTTTTPTQNPTTVGNTGAPVITGYNLINADTGATIQSLPDGSTIDLGKLPTQHLNIAAITGGTVKSVMFDYDGIYEYNLTNTNPFMLSKTNTWTPTVGKHQFFSLAAAELNEGGARSDQAWLNFNVIDSGGSTVTTTTPPGTTTTGGTTVSNPTTISNDPNAPHVFITTISSTAMAGNAVHAQGLATTLSAGDVTHTRYAWDFGDPNGAHNQMVGFNVAHVYDNPGTYTLTLTVTDVQGRTSVGKQQITVNTDTRRKIYVSQAGNDGNDGSSDAKAVKSITRANQLDTGDNVEVLFRRGDTWEMATSFFIDGHNTLVGAYGTGAQPTLKMANISMANLVHVGIESVNATVQDLNFDSDFAADLNKTGGCVGVTPGGTDCAIRNCTFTNVCDAVNADSQPHGLLVEDSVAPNVTSLRGYFTWVQGTDLVIMGNKVANSTREHIVRVGGADRVELAYNDFNNQDRTNAGDSQDISKGTFTIQKGNYVYLVGNTTRNGGIGIGPLGFGDGVNDPGARLTYVVVEGNHVIGNGIGAASGLAHVVIRNNIFERDSNEAIWIRPFDFTTLPNGKYAYEGRTVQDVSILNNTATGSGTTFRFLFLDQTEYQNQMAGQIIMDNNLYSDSNETTGSNNSAMVYVTDGNLNAFKEISHNVWSTPTTLSYADGGYFYVLSYWSNPAGYLTPGEWASNAQVSGEQYQNTTLDSNFAPGSGSKAATAGQTMGGVFTDYYGKWRSTTSPWSAGAVQI